MAKQQNSSNSKGGQQGTATKQKPKVGQQSVSDQKKVRTREGVVYPVGTTGEFVQRAIPSDVFSTRPSETIFGRSNSPQTDVSRKTETRESAQHSLSASAPLLRLSLAGISSAPLVVQPMMRVTAANDVYEQEADRVAAQVVQQINTPSSVQLQREEASVGESGPVKPILEIRRFVQRQAIGFDGGDVSSDFEGQLNQARPRGQKLGTDLQQKMEGAFGADFSGVRIHTGPQANTLNRMISAKAFTTGKDIFFSKGSFDPSSRQGQHLLAHELTHVVQQNGAAVQRKWMNSESETAVRSMSQLNTQTGEVASRGDYKHKGMKRSSLFSLKIR